MKRSMTPYSVLAFFGGLVLGAFTADAALPPKYAKMRRDATYAKARALQKKAPEVLAIVVNKVKVREVRARHRCVAERHYDVRATVLSVTRSKTGLRRGKRLRFKYSHRYQCMPGPRRYNPASVAKGQKVTVYLRAIKGKYTIAASVLSVVRPKAKKPRPR
jgi:hypothetical protein